MSARYVIGLLLVFAIVALGLGWLVGGEPPASSAQKTEGLSPASPLVNADLPGEVFALRSKLEAESSARRELAEQLAKLRLDLEASGALDPDGAAGRGAAWQSDLALEMDDEDSGGLSEEEADEESQEEADASAIENDASEKPGFDSESLIAAGLHPQEAEELRERWEEFWLDHLYMVDQAKREGWRYKPRYWREASILERELLDELGEESFDQLLYASGRPNRVIIRDVLQGSSGERAGLRPGDTILRYNDRPVYDTRKLQAATSRGKLGRSVRIEVLRGGELVVLDIDRGPLGTVLRADSAEPLSR